MAEGADEELDVAWGAEDGVAVVDGGRDAQPGAAHEERGDDSGVASGGGRLGLRLVGVGVPRGAGGWLGGLDEDEGEDALEDLLGHVCEGELGGPGPGLGHHGRRRRRSVVPPRLERLEVRLKPCDEHLRSRAVAVAVASSVAETEAEAVSAVTNVASEMSVVSVAEDATREIASGA